MLYVVIEQGEASVTIWDGVSKDKHLKPAGVMTVFIEDAEEFQVGDQVALAVRLINRAGEEDGSRDS